MTEYDELLKQLTQGFNVAKRIPEILYQYNDRKLVYQLDKVKLYHYQPKVKKPHAVPMLVVFATVNRPEILDLFPDHSFIHGLLKNGMDVYLLDWGYPELSDKHINFSDYVTVYLDHCIEFIKQVYQLPQINLLGICQGGLMCLCYAALNTNIKNLILISAPVDFHTKQNVISKIVRKLDAEELVNLSGNISGAALTDFFISLRPFELIGKKYLNFIDNLSNEKMTERFLRVEKWLHDAPDQTAASFKELIQDFYQQNKLIKNEIVLANRKVDLSNVEIPVLNVLAREDEIVPMSASKALRKYVGSKHYSERSFPSGHIGIYVSEKVNQRVAKAIAKWIKNNTNVYIIDKQGVTI